MVGKVINKDKNVMGKIILSALIICVFNFIANEFYFRIDLTKEKRFTLSASSKNLLKKLDDDLYITVFLDGDLPIEYKQLQSATRDILNEFRLASDGRVKFDFEDILDGNNIKEKESIIKEVFQKGLGEMPWGLSEKMKSLGVNLANTKSDKTVCLDRKLITGASPLASNELGKLAAQTLLGALK